MRSFYSPFIPYCVLRSRLYVVSIVIVLSIEVKEMTSLIAVTLYCTIRLSDGL